MKKKMSKQEFAVVLERDEGGWFIADVPALQGCHTQGKTKKEVLKNIKEAIALCLEAQEDCPKPSFVGIEKVTIYA
jgi:predicted RNase H-like HicB family nuclease